MLDKYKELQLNPVFEYLVLIAHEYGQNIEILHEQNSLDRIWTFLLRHNCNNTHTVY